MNYPGGAPPPPHPICGERCRGNGRPDAVFGSIVHYKSYSCTIFVVKLWLLSRGSNQGSAPYDDAQKVEWKTQTNCVGSSTPSPLCLRVRNRRAKQSLEKTKTPKDETAGKGWFHMEQAEMTPELKRDLDVRFTAEHSPWSPRVKS